MNEPRKKDSTAKGQHYIPNNSYLKYFTDSNENKPVLWVYWDKIKIWNEFKNLQSSPIPPSKFCKENYFYESNSIPVNTLEKLLEKLENKYFNILENKILQKKPLSNDDTLIISQFIAALETRTPLNKKHSEDNTKKILEKIIELENSHNLKEPSKIRKELEASLISNQVFVYTLAAAIDLNRYQFCNFQFLIIPDEYKDCYFITSDFPISMVSFTNENDFYKTTPLDTTVEVIVPITKNIAIFINNIGEAGYKQLNSYNMIDEINSRTIRRSSQFIISDRKIDHRYIDKLESHYPQSFVLFSLENKLHKARRKRLGI